MIRDYSTMHSSSLPWLVHRSVVCAFASFALQSGVRSPSVRELLEEFPHLRILSDKLLEEFSHFGGKLLEEFPHPEGRLQWSVELLEEFTHPEHRKVKNSSRSLRTLNSAPGQLSNARL